LQDRIVQLPESEAERQSQSRKRNIIRIRTEVIIFTYGGAEGIRTPDLLRAKEALSQLSYSPICLDYIS
jgi:hypothetical protein